MKIAVCDDSREGRGDRGELREHFCYCGERKVQTAYLFLSVGLIFINIFVIELMQGILEKEELLRESALAGWTGNCADIIMVSK